MMISSSCAPGALPEITRRGTSDREVSLRSMVMAMAAKKREPPWPPGEQISELPPTTHHVRAYMAAVMGVGAVFQQEALCLY